MNTIGTETTVVPPSIEVRRPLSRLVTVVVWLFALSFALDAKGAVGGSIAQYVMAGLNAFVFMLLAVNFQFVLPRRGYPAQVVYTWIAFLVAGSLGALVSKVAAEQYIRIIYPFVLFGEGFLVVWWLAREQRNLGALVNAMYVGAVVSVLYTFWWGFHFSGDSIHTIRYQIVSPLSIFLLIAATYDLVFARKRRLISFICICVVIAVLILSVTRSYVLILGGVGLVLVLAVAINAGRHSQRIPKPVLWLSIYAGLIALVVLVYLLLAPTVAARWEQRAFGPHSNVTYWTRAATVVNEWGQLTAKSSSAILGTGFGHDFVYSSDYAARLLPYTGRDVFLKPSWYAAEFMWMSIPFYGGLILGLAAVSILLLGAKRAFDALRNSLQNRSWRLADARPFWIGVVVYFAFLFDGLAGDPFVYRAAGMYFGLCLGLVAAYSLYQRSVVTAAE